jgi:hypothetical protein
MITVTAQQDFTFRQTTMTKGEARNVTGMLAFILKSKGFVAYGRPEETEKPRKKRTYRRRDLTADTKG